MEITAGTIISIISGAIGIIIILAGIIFRQIIISRIDKSEKDIDNQLNKCANHRKDIYERFLTKELFESQRVPLLEKIEGVEKDIKELWKKIDTMNIDVLGLKPAISEIQRMLIKMEDRNEK